MKESIFVKIFEDTAKQVLPNLVVEKGANLYYQLRIDNSLNLNVSDLSNPKRGNSAFQTDICIFEESGDIKLPRIVIEFKTDISTHDVLTYSAKAGKHKSVYPFLRYGLISSEKDSIPSRFFIHNEHLDFYIASKNYRSDEGLKKLIMDLIKKELEISKTLERIHFENQKFDFYSTDIKFENFSE